MIRDFHLADLFTLGNGASGTAAIFVCMEIRRGELAYLPLAGGLLVLALILDVLDGRIARLLNRASGMGRELDSLSDVISFGVAPAAMAYAIGMNGAFDVAILLYFTACGISRLARYNVTAEAIAEESSAGKVNYFEGTPIPSSVLLVLAMVGLGYGGLVAENLPFGEWHLLSGTLHPVSLVFAVSGSLMISKTIRIPKP